MLVIGGSEDNGTGFVDWSSGVARGLVVTGFQGGQHVWVTVRARDINPKKARVTVELRDQVTGASVPPGPHQWVLMMSVDAGWLTYAGITAFIDKPCDVVGRLLTASAALVDADGLTATASALVTPEWPGMCP